jgi:hypothetical protein
VEKHHSNPQYFKEKNFVLDKYLMLASVRVWGFNLKKIKTKSKIKIKIYYFIVMLAPTS